MRGEIKASETTRPEYNYATFSRVSISRPRVHLNDTKASNISERWGALDEQIQNMSKRKLHDSSFVCATEYYVNLCVSLINFKLVGWKCYREYI